MKQSDEDGSINKGTTDCHICDAKMKYNGKAYCKISHVMDIVEKLKKIHC
jgi:hypothetical protein